MLNKKNRISRDLFQNIYKKGVKISNNSLIIIYLTSSLKKTKISFVAPKSVSKKAVIRNKLKRRGKYFFLKHQNKIKDNHNIIVIFKKEVLKFSYKELEEVLLNSFKKAELGFRR